MMIITSRNICTHILHVGKEKTICVIILYIIHILPHSHNKPASTFSALPVCCLPFHSRRIPAVICFNAVFIPAFKTILPIYLDSGHFADVFFHFIIDLNRRSTKHTHILIFGIYYRSLAVRTARSQIYFVASPVVLLSPYCFCFAHYKPSIVINSTFSIFIIFNPPISVLSSFYFSNILLLPYNKNRLYAALCLFITDCFLLPLQTHL